jgi:hypothetical protein
MIPTAIQMTDENGPPVVGFFYGAELEAKNKLLHSFACSGVQQSGLQLNCEYFPSWGGPFWSNCSNWYIC